MTARIALPADPEFSATRRAIAAEQYRDDAFPVSSPASQLWQRIASRNANGTIVTNAQLERMAPVLTHTDHQPAMIAPFVAETAFQWRMAEGHYIRTGHRLTGYYVQRRSDLGFPVFKLIRTCCQITN